MFFLNKNKKGNIVLIIDISSSSVGAAVIINFNEIGKTPFILKTERLEVNQTGQDLDNDAFEKKLLLVLDKLIKKIVNEKNDFGKIDLVRVFFGPPWYKSQIINLHNKEKRKYTKKFLKKFLSHENTENSDSLLKAEKSVSVYKINGYQTNSIIDKVGDELEICTFESYISKKTFLNIKKLLKDNLEYKNIKLFTHLNTIYKVLKTHFDYKKTYTTLNITSEITEISIIRDSLFEEIISIPVGHDSIIRKIAKSKKLEFSTVSSMLSKSTYSSNLEFYKLFREYWCKEVNKIIKSENIKSLPVDVFLITHTNFQNIFPDILVEFDTYYNVFKFGRRPNIKLLNSNSITNLVDYKINTKKDPFLSIATGYLEIVE